MIMQRKLKYLFAGIILLTLVVSGKALFAQSASDFRFNEILVNNESNYTDEYGQHSSWIEIVNSSYSKVNIGGCFLTDDQSNPTKYWIPNDSPETQIAPREFVLFFADNKPSRGIFHLNFTITEGTTLYLYDANGKSLIDEIKIPAGQKADVSYARVSPDGTDWSFTDHTTPRSNNDHTRKASSGEKFVKHDPYGAGMVVIAMLVVFLVLAILFAVYRIVGSFFQAKPKAKPQGAEATAKTAETQPLSGEINAAIAMALYLYQSEQHDYENTVLTIKKVSKAYSPWSSKIYTLRKNPRI